MKPVLIAVLVNAIIASSLAAQVKPETVEVKLRGRSMPRVDTNRVKVIRGREWAPTPADSAIMRAVSDSGGRGEWLTQVGDTVWVQVVDRNLIDIPGGTSADGKALTMGTAIKVWTVRLERRSGKWVQVSRNPGI